MLDIIGQIFWFGILATPIISFLIVRKYSATTGQKILTGICITVILAVIFFGIAWAILFEDWIRPHLKAAPASQWAFCCLTATV